MTVKTIFSSMISTPTSGPCYPTKVRSHSPDLVPKVSVSYDNKLYFFGGYQKKSGNFYKDLFYYDLLKQEWFDVGAL